jgi:hypothetical protein
MIHQFIRFLFFIFCFSIVSCTDTDEVLSNCHEGIIIGKIRSAGGGIAVSVNSPHFGGHEWRGYKNVVEALNLERTYLPGTKIYFKARPAVESEKLYIVTADGDESAKPIIWVTKVSNVGCPAD